MALCYLLATGVLVTGLVLAARPFPRGFDWAYTVMSALASTKHNPVGGAWFAAALAFSAVLLWPVALRVRQDIRTLGVHPGVGHRLLQAGLIGAAFVGLERLLIYHLSAHLPKAHEVLALLTFLSLYGGLFALLRERIRVHPHAIWPAVLLVTPLLAIGASLGYLYFDQRELGWVDRRWRDLGVPVFLSFAFWQWLGAATLWTALGYLALVPPGRPPAPLRD